MSSIHSYLAAAAACLLFAAGASAQDQSARKSVGAMSVPDGSIRLDGRLDEETWLKAPVIADFVQKEPTEGAAPTDDMEVRFVYDSSALYVGARMYTRNSTALQAPLGPRDNSSQAENIRVWLDTFLDRRSAAMFGVTASGVRLDEFLSSDEEGGDSGFDPVWEARTSVGQDSWTAELWIPFSQLRFNRLEDLTWGVNVRRFRPTLNEEDYWVLVPRTESVFISRFGDLQGIRGVRPTRRIELLPYVAGSSTVNGDRDPSDPFDSGHNITSRAGLDMKMGLGPNLTLEATFNPDFGQVEADAAEVNLTAFETRFPERRPFFTENSALFNIGHPNFYYSRRIGARPRGPASDDYVDYPSDSTIIGAAKLTGRLPSRTSIAVLSAVTGEESARIASIGAPDDISRVRVAPTTVHAIGRVRQEFGSLGSSYGLFVNGMHRDVGPDDPLSNLLSTNAFAAAADTQLRFKGGEYEFRGTVGGSHVAGEAPAIERIQRASAHYAQRPDRDYHRLDPTLTSLSGWTLQAAFDRVSGRHWLFGANTKIDSENFETNDIANLNGADGMILNSNIRYRETRPNRYFRSYSISFNQSNDSTIRLLRQSGSLRPSVNVTWANFWTSSLSVSYNLPTQSVSLTRGGPLMRGPSGWTTQINVGNPSTSTTRWSGSITLTTDANGGERQRFSTSFSVRPGPQWQLSANPYYEMQVDSQQYVSTVAGGRAETYGNRYVFAFIDRTTLATEFRLSYTLKPDLTLDVYAEPFAASGRYFDFGELLVPNSIERITYGQAAGTSIATLADGRRRVNVNGAEFTLNSRDFNTLSFRSNVVLRWEWRPGSTFYLVWQQDRSETEVLGSSVGFGDMFRSATAPGQNFFVVKTSFWLPVR